MMRCHRSDGYLTEMRTTLVRQRLETGAGLERKEIKLGALHRWKIALVSQKGLGNHVTQPRCQHAPPCESQSQDEPTG